MRDEQPGGRIVVEAGGDVGGQQPGRRGQQQRVGGGVRRDRRPQSLLELQALRALFLYHAGPRDGGGEVGLAGDPQVRQFVGVGADGRGEPAHPGLHHGDQVRARVGRDDVVPLRGEQHGPGDADRAGAHLGDPHVSSIPAPESSEPGAR